MWLEDWLVLRWEHSSVLMVVLLAHSSVLLAGMLAEMLRFATCDLLIP